MKIKAYSKINFCLKVYKQQINNKHKIDSIFGVYKKLYDVIKIKPSNELSVIYKEHGKLIFLPNCIVTKALWYLHNKYGFDIKYEIVITKNIPFGAGLGGGSSDAAAVINYVLSQNKSTSLDLLEIASELGSDIPFFLTHYQMARVSGIGEKVTPILNWHPKIQLHLFPKIICSTKKVFASLEADNEYCSRVDVDKIIQDQLYKQHYINVVYNDLTRYIIQNYKELQSLYKPFKNNSFFTGAGSTIVTIKDNNEN